MRKHTGKLFHLGAWDVEIRDYYRCAEADAYIARLKWEHNSIEGMQRDIKAKLEERIAELEKGYRRYEKVRRLSVPEFAKLFEANIVGGRPFDQLVDEMP